MSTTTPLPSVAQRFLRYAQIDTQSDPDSESVPSTEKQKDLARLLLDELKDIGVEDACMDEFGYVFGTLPAVGNTANGSTSPALALLAHMDTSPDAPGAGVKPVIHNNYDGGVIALPGDPSIRLDPAIQPALLDHIGHDLITSDGTTLLGSDDKAGVAILMQLAQDLIADASTPRPTIRLCFTIDEEIGRGVDHLDLEKLGANVAYTIDGSGVGNIYTETFNAALATITVEGVMVHPGYAKGIMVNALRILAEIIAALPSHEAPENTEGRAGYIHPHDISEGDAAFARARFILRDFTEEGIQAKKDFLASLVRFYETKYPGATIKVDIKDQYQNMRSYIEQTDPRVVSKAFQAAERMGIRLEEHVIRGGTDGARLSELGIPTPNIFNGGHDFHSRFEWNSVQNLEMSLAYLKHLVEAWSSDNQGELQPEERRSSM